MQHVLVDGLRGVSLTLASQQASVSEERQADADANADAKIVLCIQPKPILLPTCMIMEVRDLHHRYQGSTVIAWLLRSHSASPAGGRFGAVCCRHLAPKALWML